MIFHFADFEFRNLMRHPFMQLPKYWDGNDFLSSLDDIHFKQYILELRLILEENEVRKIEKICSGILKSLGKYLNGMPADAFCEFNEVMKIIMESPIKIYQKSGWIEAFQGEDPLKLYRIRSVHSKKEYLRQNIFHTPFNLRSKVSSCRYSIAGYPSLYLSTSLSLCHEETKRNRIKDYHIASRYELVRNQHFNGNRNIQVIELALKPSDFNEDKSEFAQDSSSSSRIVHKRVFTDINLTNVEVRSHYLMWYPLIAASSYVRCSRNDSFAVEYIIPQLMMQWVRKNSNTRDLLGIRYFSCFSQLASEMGFNYVLPVSELRYQKNKQYCKVLAKSFILTKPIFVNDYISTQSCEEALRADQDLQSI